MPTTYIVLRERLLPGGGGEGVDALLEVLGTADVDTPRQAIKTYSEPGEDTTEEGGYVTVPLRNWTEEECEVETRVTYRTRERFAEEVETTLPPEEEPEAAKLAAVIGEPGEAA